MVLPLLPRRGHIGAGPLERVFPTVDKLPRPEEDPRTGRRPRKKEKGAVRDTVMFPGDDRRAALQFVNHRAA